MQMLEQVLFDIMGSYLIIEDKDGNIIYPTDKEKLKETRKIMLLRDENSKFLNYNNESYGYFMTDFKYEGKEYILKSLKNITQHKKIEENLIVDEISTLYNNKGFMKYFDEYLQNVIGRKKTFSCIYFDMDEFKTVNDIYGHDAGNKVLGAVGEIIKNCIRQDDIAGRIGGDEFLIILKNITEEQMKLKATSILKKLNDIEINYNGKIIKIAGASIGAYYVDSSYIKLSSSLNLIELRNKIKQKSDELMYQSKNQGKNIVTCGSNYDDIKRVSR